MNGTTTSFMFLFVVGVAACKGSGTGEPTRQTRAERVNGLTAFDAPATAADVPPRKDLMHRDNIVTAALSGDGGRIITGSVGGEVLVWSAAGFVAIGDLPITGGRGKVAALALSADGREALVALDWQPAIERWDVDARAPRGELAAHSGRTTALAYAPGGGIIATGGADRAPPSPGGASHDDEDDDDDRVPPLTPPVVRLWKGDTRLHELSGLRGRIGAIAFDQGGARVAAVGDDHVKVWSTADGHELASYDLPGEAAAVAFRGDEVCAVSSKGAACFGKGGAIAIAGTRAPTRAAAITPRWIASGTYEAIEVRGADGALRVAVPGRAYAVLGAGDDLWAILADTAIPVRSGVVAGPVTLKLPQP